MYSMETKNNKVIIFKPRILNCSILIFLSYNMSNNLNAYFSKSFQQPLPGSGGGGVGGLFHISIENTPGDIGRYSTNLPS